MQVDYMTKDVQPREMYNGGDNVLLVLSNLLLPLCRGFVFSPVL